MIHGLQKYLARLGFLADVVDWTDGCIAVTHGDIEEVWQLVSVDTPVGIRP
jgi:murein L,D-transpeptidase YafK